VGGNSIVEAWTLDIAWKFHGACFVTEFGGTVCGYTLLDIAWKFHGACFVTEFAGTVCGYTLLLLIFFR
jgi:hypothetical protein